MLKQLYKRIVRKFGLTQNQLRELKSRLVEENICKGPFVQGEKTCPNTTALAVKENITKFDASAQVKPLLIKHGIRKIELWVFYILFDLPALLSEKYFRNSLVAMKGAIDELLQE